MKRISILLACLAALAAPGSVRADDADVTAAVTRWSLRISGPAKELSTTLSGASTPQEALGFLRSFTAVATKGSTAVGATRSSSKKGAQVRMLARNAFLRYASAGRLLIRAVDDVRAGRPKAAAEAKIELAVKLAVDGSAKLARAGKLVPQLVGG